MLCWRNPENGRRYAMRLERDLFGNTVLTCIYSGEHARKGRIVTVPVPASMEIKTLREACRRRRSHGYRLTRIST